MADTFSTLYNEIRALVPFVPTRLAQRWVQRRFIEAQYRNLWAVQKAQSEFLLPATYGTGTVNVTAGSAAVVGVGTLWVANAAVGRQFYVAGRAPFYTISAIASDTSLTLDRPFGEATATGASYEISLVFVTPPSDFLTFDSAVDVSEERPLRVNIPREYLDWRDPNRTSSGTPRLIAQATFSTAGVPRYEIWERSSSRTIRFGYYKTYSFAADADVLPLPFQSAAIIEGATADLSRWPGTGERQNPYYDLAASDKHEARFQFLTNEAMRQDQEIYQTDIEYPRSPFITDPNWIRSHDVDFDNYGGF